MNRVQGTFHPGTFHPFLLFLVLLLALVVIRTTTAFLEERSQVGWQAHSYDDLATWFQLVAKGARNIKVDAHFASADLCSQQPAFSADAKLDASKGCFLLSHDKPVSGRPGGRAYNTTHEIFDLLGDPRMQELVLSGKGSGEPFFIAVSISTRNPVDDDRPI